MDTLFTDMDGACYIGDPCYVFTHEQWNRIMEQTNVFGYGDKKDIDFEGVFYINGEKCGVASTTYGDGVYEAKVGGRVIANLGVDSGTLGFVPIKAISDECLREAMKFGIILNQEWVKAICEEGVFHFGVVTINTN